MTKDATTKKGTLPEWGKKLLLVFSSIFMGLLMLESAVRIVEPREVMRYFFMTPDPVVSHKFTPNAKGRYKTTEFDIEYAINSLGLRDRELTLEKPGGAFRILMLGDSFTEGDGVRLSETFSSRLQGILDTANGGLRCQVINGGVGSYSPLLEYLYLKNGGLDLKPDLVILNFDLSDVYDDIFYTSLARFDRRGIPVAVGPLPEYRAASWADGLLVMIKDFLKDNTRLYNFIRIRIDRYIEVSRHQGTFTGNIHYDKYAMLRESYNLKDDRDFTLSYKYLLMIRDTLKARGIDFWVTVYPYGLQVSPREWGTGRQIWGFKADTVYSTRPQELVQRFCQNNSIPIINMCDDFKLFARTFYPLCWDINGHWLPAGHELVARVIFQDLKPYLYEKTGAGSRHESYGQFRTEP